jgi:hypothetical protein
MSRWAAAVVSVGLVGATLEPVVREPDDDGFPLATYPMFAVPRPAVLAMSYAQGVTAEGALRTLSPEQLGTGEVMQAFALLQRAAAAGPRASNALCTAIAARVAADAGYRDVIAIRIVTGRFDAPAALVHGAAGAELAREVTRARCELGRPR